MPGSTTETPLIDIVFGLGNKIGQAYDVTATTINKMRGEPLYQADDVKIINEARKIYFSIFEDEPLPIELRYRHEDLTKAAKLPVEPVVPPASEGYRAPRILKEQYSINDFELGETLLKQLCRNPILKLSAYVNALNEKAGKLLNKTGLVRYRHKSDAIRAIALLLMNAFTALSRMSLDNPNTFETIYHYISFLKRLNLSSDITLALQKISNVDVDEVPETPLTAFIDTLQYLEKIQKTVEYHQSKSSIAEKVNELLSSVDSFITSAFVFSSYVITDEPVAELHTRIEEQQIDFSSDAPTIVLLRKALSSDISFADQKNAPLLLKDNPSEALERFTYNEATGLWVGLPSRQLRKGNSGIYPVFLNHETNLINIYLEYCGTLKLLAETISQILCLKENLEKSGQYIMVLYFSAHIIDTLNVVRHSAKTIWEAEKQLREAATSEFNRLSKLVKHTEKEKNWLNNYRSLNAAASEHTRNQAFKRLSSNIARIQADVESWIENPFKQLEKLRSNLAMSEKNLLILTKKIQRIDPTFVASILRHRHLELPILETIAGSIQFTDGQQESSGIEELPDDSPTETTDSLPDGLNPIYEKLFSYATSHGYQFVLQKAPRAIQLDNPTENERHRITKKEYQNELNEHRIHWFFHVFSSLYASSSEEKILEQLCSQLYKAENDRRINPERALSSDSFLALLKACKPLIMQRQRVLDPQPQSTTELTTNTSFSSLLSTSVASNAPSQHSSPMAPATSTPKKAPPALTPTSPPSNASGSTAPPANSAPSQESSPVPPATSTPKKAPPALTPTSPPSNASTSTTPPANIAPGQQSTPVPPATSTPKKAPPALTPTSPPSNASGSTAPPANSAPSQESSPVPPATSTPKKAPPALTPTSPPSNASTSTTPPANIAPGQQSTPVPPATSTPKKAPPAPTATAPVPPHESTQAEVIAPLTEREKERQTQHAEAEAKATAQRVQDDLDGKAFFESLKRWLQTVFEFDLDSSEVLSFDTNKRKAFLTFWNALCFLEQGLADHLLSCFWDAKYRSAALKRLEALHVEFFSKIQASEEKVHLLQGFQNELLSIQAEAHNKGKTGVIRIPQTIIRQLERLDGFNEAFTIITIKPWLSDLIEKGQKEHHELDREALSKTSAISWSEDVKTKLIRAMEALEEETRIPANRKRIKATDIKPNSKKFREYLERVDYWVLAKGPRGDASYKAADAFLSTLLDARINPQRSAEDNAFLDKLIRGCYVLGASPLPWMDKNLENQVQKAKSGGGSVPKVDTQDFSAYRLVSEQIRLILSHITHRARYLGDSVTLLQEPLNELTDAIIEFADQLNDADTENNRSIGGAISEFLGRTNRSLQDGAKLERATVLWTALKLVHLVLNESLIASEADQVLAKINSDGNLDITFTADLNDSESLFKQAHLAHKNRLNHDKSALNKLRNKLFNTGLKSSIRLKAAIEKVEGELDKLALFRALRISEAKSKKKDDHILELGKKLEEQDDELPQRESVFEKGLVQALKRYFLDKKISLSKDSIRKTFSGAIEEIQDIFSEFFDLAHVEKTALQIMQTDERYKDFMPYLDGFSVASSEATQPTAPQVAPSVAGTPGTMFASSQPQHAAAASNPSLTSAAQR